MRHDDPSNWSKETRLLDLRQAVASTVAPTHVEPVPVVTTAMVMKALTAIQGLAAASPMKAREVLAAVIERIVLTPAETGYQPRLTLKSINPAALSDGRVDVVGCGGRI